MSQLKLQDWALFCPPLELVFLGNCDNSLWYLISLLPYPSLEPSAIGTYDDTMLNLLDDVMVTAASYGIKLLISCHSFNAPSAGDVYGATYGTEGFYTSSTANGQFENRLWHILYHAKPSNGKAWKDCSEYIFAFEAQREAMSVDSTGSFAAANASWQCTMETSPKTA